MVKFLILSSVIFILSCAEQPYTPKDLRKLTHEEIEARVRRGIMPNPNLVLKNEQGKIITADSIPHITDIESWTTDVYVNAKGLDVELVLRKLMMWILRFGIN